MDGDDHMFVYGSDRKNMRYLSQLLCILGRDFLLDSLNLSENRISEFGLKYLKDKLLLNTHLKHLNLSDNRLGLNEVLLILRYSNPESVYNVKNVIGQLSEFYKKSGRQPLEISMTANFFTSEYKTLFEQYEKRKKLINRIFVLNDSSKPIHSLLAPTYILKQEGNDACVMAFSSFEICIERVSHFGQRIVQTYTISAGNCFPMPWTRQVSAIIRLNEEQRITFNQHCAHDHYGREYCCNNDLSMSRLDSYRNHNHRERICLYRIRPTLCSFLAENTRVEKLLQPPFAYLGSRKMNRWILKRLEAIGISVPDNIFLGQSANNAVKINYETALMQQYMQRIKANSPKLLVVDLADVNMSDADSHRVMAALFKNTIVHTLDFRGNRLTVESMYALINLLSHNRTIHTVLLDDNLLLNEEAHRLIEGVIEPILQRRRGEEVTCEAVNLQGCRAEVLPPLFNYLQYYTRVLELNLSGLN